MKKIILILFLFIAGIPCFSQQEKYIFLVNELCNEINPQIIRKLPPEQIQFELMKIGNKIRNSYSDVVNELTVKIKKENPSWSEKELLKEYFRNFTFLAVDSCPVYFELVLIPLGECPKENSTLKLLFDEAEKYLSQNSEKSYVELNELVVEHIVKIVFSNQAIIEKDYKDGIANPQLIDDMNSYLFHKSKNYMKVMVAVQLDKLIDNM